MISFKVGFAFFFFVVNVVEVEEEEEEEEEGSSALIIAVASRTSMSTNEGGRGELRAVAWVRAVRSVSRPLSVAH